MKSQQYMERIIEAVKEQAALYERQMRENHLEFLGLLVADTENHADVIAKKKNRTDDEESFLKAYDRLFERHEIGQYMQIVRNEGMDILKQNMKLRESHPERKGITLVETINKIAEAYE